MGEDGEGGSRRWEQEQMVGRSGGRRKEEVDKAGSKG